MIRVLPLKLGSNPSILVQFYDPDTDLPINLAGATSVTASADPESGGSPIALTASVTDAANGKVRLDYSTAAFTTAGLYRLEVAFTSADGKKQIYPPEDGQLKLKLSAANG